MYGRSMKTATRALLAILLAIPILTAIPVVAAFVSGAALLMALRLATDR